MIDMAMEYKYGLMELSTKDNGIIIKLKEKEHFGMLREMYMMENSKMIRLTAMEYILMLMDRDMRGFGKMICRRDMEVRYGVMELNIQGLIRKEKNIIMGSMNGLMHRGMKEIGMKIR